MFSKTIFTAAVACGLLASSVNAHMVIRSPIPYGQDSLNNSPLEADGSDFPCKQRSGVYDLTKMNEMAVGVPQDLAFKGGATHGGGSCQVSITSDEKPTKDSQWKVIHSIIGGCPSNSSANLSGDPNGEKSSVFQYSIPKDVPNGRYTLAWTWFNKIGNREMYMNCAPITVTGGSAKSKRDMDSLPDMFVANIGNGCTVAESQDFVFPNCGANAETVMKTALGSSTIGTCATVAAGGSNSGSGSGAGSGSGEAAPTATGSYGSGSGSGSGSGASAPAGYASSSSAPAAPAYGGGSSAAPKSAPAAPAYSSPSEQDSGAGGIGNGGMRTVVNMHTVTAWATVTATGEVPAGYTAPSTYSGGTNSDSGSAAEANTNGTASSASGSCAGQTCTNDGEVVCIGTSQWGICDAGCAVARALADGTTCSNGVITKRSTYTHLKRHLHRGRSF